MSQDATQIVVFDTTLRDGEQAPGFSMDVPSKLTLARALDALGVDIIEAGFPIASPADSEATRQVAREVRRPVIAALARCRPQDIDEAARALEPAERRRIHTFLATSDLHLERKLRITREACLDADRRRRPPRAAAHRRCGVFGGGCDAQRSRLPVPGRRSRDRRRRDDHQPARHGRLHHARRDPRVLRRDPPPRAELPTRPSSARTATTTSAWRSPTAWRPFEGGVRQVECTINGIGERAGNASLEEIVMALRVRHDRLPYDTAIQSEAPVRGEPAALAAHRRTGPVEQGHRRPQRVRARSRHPPGRHAEGLADLRDHAAAGCRPERRAARARPPLRPSRRAAARRAARPDRSRAEELAQVYHAVITMGEHRKSIGDNDLQADGRARPSGTAGRTHRLLSRCAIDDRRANLASERMQSWNDSASGRHPVPDDSLHHRHDHRPQRDRLVLRAVAARATSCRSSCSSTASCRPTSARRRSSPRCSCTAAGRTSSATCGTCGSSATTSKIGIGHGRFVVFYLLCGIVAALGQIVDRSRSRRCRRSARAARSPA